MNKIQQKLRSRAGASMILAMVFMLFCSFIGGTVLASATANAQRVAQMAEQQDFLLERSAALLASDQLQLDDGKYLRMSIKDEVSLIEEAVKVNDGGAFDVSGDKAEVRTISFQVLTNATLTPMHRLMLEATVWRYLHEFDPEGTAVSLIFVNFPGGVSATDQFQFKPEIQEHRIEGVLNVTATSTPVGGTSVTIPDYNANFSSGRDLDLFDFFVDFGENSQVRMTMNAFSGAGNPIIVPDPYTVGSVPGDANPSGYIKVTRTSITTTISWEDPLIEKGGAD